MGTNIKFDAHDYRKHNDRNKELINKSLKECGAGRSIVIDNDNEIIAGNGIYEQAQKLGLKTKVIETDGSELVVVKRTDLQTDDAKRKQLAVMDNSTSDSSEFDFELLQEDFDTEELDDWGLDVDFAIEEEEKEVVEDEVPEEVETRCKLGDIWQLGSHKLMCGDSTKVDDVEKLMNGEKADMVFTDPPYGMKKEKDGVLNDNLNFDDLLDFNRQWIPLTFGALKDNGSWYCWGIDEPLMDIYSNILKPMAKENKISIQNYITWDKGTGFGQMSNLQRSYSIATEKCWFVICGVQGYNNNSDNYFDGFEPIRAYLEAECEKCGGHKIWKQMLGNNMGHHYFTKSQWCFPTKEAYEKMQAFGKEYGAFGKEYEEIKKQYEEIKKEWYDTRAYFDNTHDNMNDVWHFNRTSESERKDTGGHATPKPIALCSRAIKSSSRENETILDVFGGSGSTLIACEQLNRKCYMMELDEKYCDVIITRWENLTGKKAVKIG